MLEESHNPHIVQPTLHNLRSAIETLSITNKDDVEINNNKDGISSSSCSLNLIKTLLSAADRDIMQHHACIPSVIEKNPCILRNYNRDADKDHMLRSSRRKAFITHIEDLENKGKHILQNLHNADLSEVRNSITGNLTDCKKHLTQADLLQERLRYWEKALDLYVHCPSFSSMSFFNISRNQRQPLSILQLLDTLCGGCTEYVEMVTALTQALSVCNDMVDATTFLINDANVDALEEEDRYRTRIHAHYVLAQHALNRTDYIKDQFLKHGRMALKIGHALESAEAQRRTCDGALQLIRHWWVMEYLAEQEDLSGEQLKVDEEVQGLMSSSSCRMDPLYTKSELSLEASLVLKRLRNVIKRNIPSEVRTEAVNRNNSTSSQFFETYSLKRFELTSHLLKRTCIAFERRLINSFSKIYTNGGVYDFSSFTASKRIGCLDWMALREIAESCNTFDHGRNLHQCYIELVVSINFPEFVDGKHWKHKSVEMTHKIIEDEREKSNEKSVNMRTNDASKDKKSIILLREQEFNGSEFIMENIQQKLSELFHRACEVCTREIKFISYIFSPRLPSNLGKNINKHAITSIFEIGSSFVTDPVIVVRALIERIICHPVYGMQAYISILLENISCQDEFETGSKKLDAFVVIHEKAAGLFHLLKEAVNKIWCLGNDTDNFVNSDTNCRHDNITHISGSEICDMNTTNSKVSLVHFLTSQENALSRGHRRSYLNLELLLLYHKCCTVLGRVSNILYPAEAANDHNEICVGLGEFCAPIMSLDKDHLQNGGFKELLNGPLKQATLRQPLVHATDSLARVRLMFGVGAEGGGDVYSTARVTLTIFNQMCNFYGSSYLYPIVECLSNMLQKQVPPSTPASLPIDENAPPLDLGVEGNFWMAIERINSASKSFDRELWAENRSGSMRVWEILTHTNSSTSLTLAKDRRVRFFQELEERGEAVILQVLDTLETHMEWMLVSGEEGVVTGSGPRLLQNPVCHVSSLYTISTGSLQDTPNSPAIKALTFCLRSQFVHIQSALTPSSLSAFWIALSMRLYNIVVSRLLLHYHVSTVGSVILSRDVEALRSTAMLAGNEQSHQHWENLRELLTLYMTPPDALKTILVGDKGLIHRAGKEQSIVFMSRRTDYHYKTIQGLKKSQWVLDLMNELGLTDHSDGVIDITKFVAEQHCWI